ncbi:MAG: dihydrofolate reductase family protein, partial [Microbacterium gubbeenense]
HSEGGPSMFGSSLAQGAVDELCLTLAPTLEGGTARRIAASAEASPTPMQLISVLRSGEELLLRYRRARDAS